MPSTATLLRPPEQHWVCPNCNAARVTFSLPDVGTTEGQYHFCPGLAGIIAPLVLDGVKCKVHTREREDYVGDELVQRDANGRPIMAVITTRSDSDDCMVLAPTARGSLHGR